MSSSPNMIHDWGLGTAGPQQQLSSSLQPAAAGWKSIENQRKSLKSHWKAIEIDGKQLKINGNWKWNKSMNRQDSRNSSHNQPEIQKTSQLIKIIAKSNNIDEVTESLWHIFGTALKQHWTRPAKQQWSYIENTLGLWGSIGTTLQTALEAALKKMFWAA